MKAKVALTTIIGVLLLAQAEPAFAADWQVDRDGADDYRATSDLVSVAVLDTDEAVSVRFRVRDLKGDGKFKASMGEWDENGYDLMISKRKGHQVKVSVWYYDYETGDSSPAKDCKLRASWRPAQDVAKVRIKRSAAGTSSSCLYEDSGMQYGIGMMISQAKFARGGTTDKLR